MIPTMKPVPDHDSYHETCAQAGAGDMLSSPASDEGWANHESSLTLPTLMATADGGLVVHAFQVLCDALRTLGRRDRGLSEPRWALHITHIACVCILRNTGAQTPLATLHKVMCLAQMRTAPERISRALHGRVVPQ